MEKLRLDEEFIEEVVKGLKYLQEAGKVKNRFLSGMLWATTSKIENPQRLTRVLGLRTDTSICDTSIWVTVEGSDGGTQIARPWELLGVEPDDPATTGCLHALAEEVYGRPLCPMRNEEALVTVYGRLWCVYLFPGTSSQWTITAETLGVLWATVLVHLARI